MAFFMVVGFVMKITGFPFVAYIIGFVLGGSFEISFQQTLIMSRNNVFVLFTRPISGTIMVTTIIFIAYTVYSYFKNRKLASKEHA
jgi:putative tricarboxylic transport membrane protein